MKEKHIFEAGDKVFAKVKGYRAWPAYIVRQEKVKNGVKYHVVFYETNEKACLKAQDLFPYGPFKEKYGKPTKVQSFNRALELIEKDSSDVSKSSLAAQLSAVQADIEEIQKITKKQALEEVGEGSLKSTKRLVVDEEDIEEMPITSKKRALDESPSKEPEASTSQGGRDLGVTAFEKKRQKLGSESSEHLATKKSDTSPKKSNKMDNVEHDENVKKDGTADNTDTVNQKGRVSPKKKVPDLTPFRAKTVYGEDPGVHLQKVELFKKNRVKTKANEQQDDALQKNSKSSDTKPKRVIKKTDKIKMMSKGKAQMLSKQNDKGAPGTSSNGQGLKQLPREQFDVVNFEKGALVLARVKGYPPWPAVVTGNFVEKKKMLFIVSFYASMQEGHCPAEHLFPYEKYKEEYSYIRVKNSSLNRAFELIEEATEANKRKKGGKSTTAGPGSVPIKTSKDNIVNGDVSSSESATSSKDKSMANGRAR